jgi:hypothetical protein
MEKTCPKCKSTFICKNEMPGCWCGNLKLSDYTLRYLKTNFDGCLCYECLKPFEIVDMDAEIDIEDGY